MKQKTILVGLMLLVTSFAFGQHAPVKNHRKSTESRFEKHLKDPGSKDRKNNHSSAFQKYRNNSQDTRLKSSQTIKQRLDSLIGQEWDETASQWVDNYKEVYIYDATGNVTQYLGYEWDEAASQWVAFYKEEYTYDSNGNMTQYLGYEWDETTSQWVTYYKEEYTYDTNGNVTQYLGYEWDETSSQWVAYYKEEYTYDANGNVTQYLGYEWDETTSQWINYYKDEYTYDANGNLTQYFGYDWDESTSQWVAYYKEEYTYDASGNVTQYLDYDWDESTSQLVASWKEEYTYDTNGNMTLYLNYEWDETTSQWVAYWKGECTYNNTYSFNDLLLPFFFASEETSIYFNHMLTSLVSYEKADTDTWVQESKSILYYSEQNVTSINDIETEDFQVYPNPVSEYLNFSFRSNSNSATFELFDLQSRRLISKKITNNEQLSLEDLNNGMYLYILYIDGIRHSGKLIKE